MKKFVTFVSQQKKLEKLEYKAIDNPRLEYTETAFPILSVMNGYLQPEDTFQIIAITADYIFTKKNCELLKEEVMAFCDNKKIKYDEENFKEIEIPFDDGINVQIELFQKLINEIQSGDEIYACITYGSKPAEITELMTLRYARQLKDNTYIGCIVYGQVNREENIYKGRIYDLTAMLHLDDMIQTLANSNISEPEKLIQNLLAE